MTIDQVFASISCRYEYTKGKRSKHPKVRINIRGLGDYGFFDFDESRKLYPEGTLQVGLCLVKANALDFPDMVNPKRTFSFGSTGDYGNIQFNAPDLGFPDEEFNNVEIKITAIDTDSISFEQLSLADIHARLAEQEAQSQELEEAYRQRLEEGNTVGQLPEIDASALDALEREANRDSVSVLLPRLRIAMQYEGLRKITVRV